MTKLNDINLVQLTPDNLKRDKRILSLAKALDIQLKKVTESAGKLNFETNLEKLDESVIDHMLWEKHITENEGLLLAKNKLDKIALIRSSERLHKHKGTPFAIEEVLRVLGLRGEVEEWFLYDGEPYHFLVELDLINNLKSLKLAEDMVLEYKNVRSWFDGFVILISAGTILLINDSYSYEVIYKDCGWFAGLKHFNQIDLENLFLNLKNYDYVVEYDVAEKMISYLELLEFVLIEDNYSYIKELYSSGQMPLLEKSVSTQEFEIKTRFEYYGYGVDFDGALKKHIDKNIGCVHQLEDSYSYIKKLYGPSDVPLLNKGNKTLVGRKSIRENSYVFKVEIKSCGKFYCGE